jgi:hypothetical protein
MRLLRSVVAETASMGSSAACGGVHHTDVI